MSSQGEPLDLLDQAVRHALVAERMGFVGTAKALWALAQDIEAEGGAWSPQGPGFAEEGVAPFGPSVPSARARQPAGG